MNIRSYGDTALLLNFEQKISPNINAKVVAWNQAIQKANISSVVYTIPAYCSLTVVFDPVQTNHQQLAEHIKSLELPKNSAITAKTHQVPVCYEQPYALDIQEVAQQTGLDHKEIIQIHTQDTFQVYMLGFLPGFAYMGKLPKELYCRRKLTPRPKVPACAVGLAGQQTGIYPSVAPGGWQIIGQTPIPIFNPNKEQPFLFSVGDRVQFQAISQQEFEQLSIVYQNGY
ncbi:MAG: 5-oxoprolinase subunit PxpB [Aureispira sp.]|nr:5-oxoprolinase subunit PxpB [Aureispira sp.]